MKKIFIYLLALIPGFILLPFINSYPYSIDSGYSDLTISHLAYAAYIHHWIGQGIIPLWYETILSGIPLSANPLSGLFYPFGWLLIIFPNAVGANISVILHLIFGSFGMIKFLKEKGLSAGSVAIGGIAFPFMTGVWGHYAAGHITLLYSIMWLPWLFLAIQISICQQPSLKSIIFPGLVMGMMILADVRMAAICILFGFLFSLTFYKVYAISIVSLLKYIFLIFLLALCISAPLLLPLFEFTQLSTRSAMTLQETTTLALPMGNLLNFFTPVFHGFSEYLLYPSALIMLSAIGAVAIPASRKKVIFWIATAAFFLLLSLGNQVPGVHLFFQLPGFNLLRVPARFILLSIFSLIVIASYGFDALIRNESEVHPSPILFLTSATAFPIIGLIGTIVINGNISAEWLWGSCAFFCGILLWIAIKRHWINKKIGGLLACVFILTDLMVSNIRGIDFKDQPDGFSIEGEIAQIFMEQEGLYRVYSPSYSLAQYPSALLGLSLADGVDPLQLQSYVDFMSMTTGVPSTSYSVTLPPFATGNPSTDNRHAVPDTNRLGLLNVRYLVSAFPINSQGLRLVSRVNDVYIYENNSYLPRVWVQSESNLLGAGIINIPIISWSPNSIRIEAEGPGLLVLSEINYPGWQVEIDGERANPINQTSLLRTVYISSGVHEVVYSFVPLLVYLGIIFSCLGGLVIILLWITDRKH